MKPAVLIAYQDARLLSKISASPTVAASRRPDKLICCESVSFSEAPHGHTIADISEPGTRTKSIQGTLKSQCHILRQLTPFLHTNIWTARYSMVAPEHHASFNLSLGASAPDKDMSLKLRRNPF